MGHIDVYITLSEIKIKKWEIFTLNYFTAFGLFELLIVTLNNKIRDKRSKELFAAKT